MEKQHDFRRVFMSGLTTFESWICTKCGTTAESNWDNKTNKRENQKINGSEVCS